MRLQISRVKTVSIEPYKSRGHIVRLSLIRRAFAVNEATCIFVKPDESSVTEMSKRRERRRRRRRRRKTTTKKSSQGDTRYAK